MAKKSLLIKQARKPKFAVRAYLVAKLAAGREQFIRNFYCAEFASGKWPTKGLSLVSSKLAGKLSRRG